MVFDFTVPALLTSLFTDVSTEVLDHVGHVADIEHIVMVKPHLVFLLEEIVGVQAVLIAFQSYQIAPFTTPV